MRRRMMIDVDDYMGRISQSEKHTLSGMFKNEKEEEKVITILSDDQFKLYMETFFYYYKMLIKEPEDPEELDQKVIDQFNAMWLSFQVEEQENINKMLASYYWEYVPVYNYDRYEEWDQTKNGNETHNRTLDYKQHIDTETDSGSESHTKDYSGSYKDTHVNGATTNTNEVATMDTQVETPDPEDRWSYENRSSTGQFTDTDERTYTNYQEKETIKYSPNNDTREHKTTFGAHTDTDNLTDTYNNVHDNHVGHMYGNIGVTTSVQMATEEFEFRVHELGYEFLKRFCDRCMFML